MNLVGGPTTSFLLDINNTTDESNYSDLPIFVQQAYFP